MQPLSGNQRPDLLTSLMNMSLVLRLPREMHLSRSSSNVPRLPSFLELLQNPHVLLTFGKVHNPLRLQRKTTSEPSKVIWARGVFNILTWKCASRHSGVHFLLISTSKSAPNLVCFVDFDFEMCFVPQRRALFAHLNFQKCSEPGVLCRFWLPNVLRATMACAFSISQLLKALRSWGVFYILTWKCASRHKGVHFFDISASKSAPSLKCFARFDFEMCFAPQRHPIFHLSSGQMAPHPPLWRAYFSTLQSHKSLENIVNRDFAIIRAPATSFFWLFLFSDLLSSSLLFSDSSHLCFPICPYCRKFDF